MLDLLIFVWFILAVVVTWALTRASSRLDVHHHPRLRVTPGDGFEIHGPDDTLNGFRIRGCRVVPSNNGYTIRDFPRIVTDDDGEP